MKILLSFFSSFLPFPSLPHFAVVVSESEREPETRSYDVYLPRPYYRGSSRCQKNTRMREYGRLQVPGKRICPVKPFDLHGYSPPPSEHTCCCSQNPCVVLLMSSRSSARFPSDLSQNPSCPLTDLKSIFPLQLPCWDPVVAWRIGSPGGGTAGSSGGNGLGAGRPRGC